MFHFSFFLGPSRKSTESIRQSGPKALWKDTLAFFIFHFSVFLGPSRKSTESIRQPGPKTALEKRLSLFHFPFFIFHLFVCYSSKPSSRTVVGSQCNAIQRRYKGTAKR
jgi:hypothetical protein